MFQNTNLEYEIAGIYRKCIGYQGETNGNILEKNKSTSANKRKLENNQSDYCEGLKHLFDESNEDVIIENIDEKTLEEENKLPLAGGDKINLISSLAST
ncbi:hypothetical protein C1645_824719 [Glomus cerebriforme]|uniref:Uncharacterized protein n=1 Tax=Glomus cerebriforme TaxID=658196 RepID=A0A397T0G1_9GLOM|nr:hypothetical protein C1645_824719 [Glomus cerebriforme]